MAATYQTSSFPNQSSPLAQGGATTSIDTAGDGVTRKRIAQPGSLAAQANTVLNQAGEHANTALIKSKTHLQRFLDQHDLTPQNQLIWHACYASVISIGLLILPSLVLKYNIPIAVLRGAFGIAGKQSGHKVYALLFAGLGASSFLLSGPLWHQTRNSLEHVAVARLAIAAAALFFTFFIRVGSDALLLLGIGELVAGIVLIKTERLEMDNLVTAAKDGASVAQGHAQVLAGHVQEQASLAQAKLQQSELGAKLQAHPIGQKIIGAPVETAAPTTAPQPTY